MQRRHLATLFLSPLFGISVLPSSPSRTPIFQESGKFSNALAPIFLEWRDSAKFFILEILESNGDSESIFFLIFQNLSK